MSRQKTHVAIILDKSGSMGSIRAQAIQNYNEQIQQMKENAKDQDIFCSLITFNGEVFEHLWDEDVTKLEEADYASYVPAGSTALRDAIGYTIQKLQSTTTLDDNTAYLLLIISDGDENASTKFNVSQLREMIESCQATNHWTITYMGCDERYIKKLSEETSIPISNCAVWSNDLKLAAGTMKAARSRNDGYFASRSRGLMATSNLYSDVGDKCMNFVDEVASQPVDLTIENVLPNDNVPVKNVCKKGKIVKKT